MFKFIKNFKNRLKARIALWIDDQVEYHEMSSLSSYMTDEKQKKLTSNLDEDEMRFEKFDNWVLNNSFIYLIAVSIIMILILTIIL